MVTQLPPAAHVQDGPYDLRSLQAPVLSGFSLKAFIKLSESSLFHLILPKLMRDSGIPQALSDISIPDPPRFTPNNPVPSQPEDHALHLPEDASQRLQRLLDSVGGLEASSAAGPGPTPTTLDYARAYRSGSTTPTQVAQRIIAFLKQQEHLCWMAAWSEQHILQQAEASTERFQQGSPLSLLDGVPFAVKDLLDALPYPTAGGTAFMADRRPVQCDAPYVASLKALGALLLGKSSTHEVGICPTGVNPVAGTARNPHDVQHITGGSSSGSAALVAAGVCPFAVGTDGGGSIRIPAAACGCVGLKPSSGRISHVGSFGVDCTVSTAGPIAGSVLDAAILYAVMANNGPSNSGAAPPPALPRQLHAPTAAAGTTPGPTAEPADSTTSAAAAPSSSTTTSSSSSTQPLTGLKVGVYRPWYSSAEPHVVAACDKALQVLQQLGAQLCEVVIPELELLRVAHVVTISSEIMHNMAPAYAEHELRAQLCMETRLIMTIARNFTATDYLQAQRIRQRATVHFERTFSQVDLLVTPTLPMSAPRLNAAMLGTGEHNLKVTSDLIRYMAPANMLGLPGLSLPVGVSSGEGGAAALPLGLQLMAAPWREATLLRAGAALEAALPAAGVVMPQPQVHINPLAGSS